MEEAVSEAQEFIAPPEATRLKVSGLGSGFMGAS